MKRSLPPSSSCNDEEDLPKMNRSSPSPPSCHDEGKLPETKRSRPSYSSARGYHYECKLSEDDNSILNPPENTVLGLVSTVRINFRVNYILRLSGGDVGETLDSIQMCFYMRLYVITGAADFENRLCSREFCQSRGDMLYDVNQPEAFFRRFLRYIGVLERDVIEKLIGDIKDFVNGRRSSNRVLSMAVSMKVYTLQQEDETIDDAKLRAITTNSKGVDCANRLIKLLERPPPYKFVIEFDDHHEMLKGDCCICLNKLSVGEEVLFMSCSHAYHYHCLILWLEKGQVCPLCRCPMNLRLFVECCRFREEKLKLQKGGYKSLDPEHTIQALLAYAERLKNSSTWPDE